MLRDTKDTATGLGSGDPIHVLGETQGLGKSWIVSLAYEKHRAGSQTHVIFASGIVAPHKPARTGWMPMSATSGDTVRSPAGSITVTCHLQAGLWLVLGLMARPEAASTRLTLNNGRVVEPPLHDSGFVVVADEDPLPMTVSVYQVDGQLIETFQFPTEKPWFLRLGQR